MINSNAETRLDIGLEAFDRSAKLELQKADLSVWLRLRWVLTWGALIAVCGCSPSEPDRTFLSRRMCVLWAGQCQLQQATTGELATACRRSDNSLEWNVLSETKAILRCYGRDKMTNERTDQRLQFEAYAQGNDLLAAVTRMTINGEEMDQASLYTAIVALNRAIQSMPKP